MPARLQVDFLEPATDVELGVVREERVHVGVCAPYLRCEGIDRPSIGLTNRGHRGQVLPRLAPHGREVPADEHLAVLDGERMDNCAVPGHLGFPPGSFAVLQVDGRQIADAAAEALRPWRVLPY
jgi:hypothetical protein